MNARMSIKGLLLRFARIVGLVLLSGLAAGILVRDSPGALVDERELNQRLGEDSLTAMRAEKQRSAGEGLLVCLKGLVHGDLGTQSRTVRLSLN